MIIQKPKTKFFKRIQRVYIYTRRITVKQISARAHRSFNETCLNNKLLPPYTNMCIYK